MELIPAPGRQWQTVSMWLLLAGGFADLVVLTLTAIEAIPGLSVSALATAHIALGVAIGVARFIKQVIALTHAEKVSLIQSASDQPVKDGAVDVRAVVVKVPATP